MTRECQCKKESCYLCSEYCYLTVLRLLGLNPCVIRRPGLSVPAQ